MNQVDELGVLRERAQDLGLLPLVRKITWLRNMLLRGHARIPYNVEDRINLFGEVMDNYEVRDLELPRGDIKSAFPEATGNVFAAGTRMELNHKLAQSFFEDKELERYRNPSSFGVTVAVPPRPPTKAELRAKRKKNKRPKAKPTMIVEDTWKDSLAAAFTQAT